MRAERKVIIDYGCCLPFGHNLQSVNLYESQAADEGFKTLRIVCDRVRSFLPEKIKGHYDYSLPTLYEDLVIDAEGRKLYRFFIKSKIKLNKMLDLVYAVCTFGKITRKQQLANNSAERIFRKFKFGRHDILIMPSADYFGTIAILKQIRKIPKEQRPKLHIRFIGVLENVSGLGRRGVLDIIGNISGLDKDKKIESLEAHVEVTAEVPIYTRFLEISLPNVTVRTEPYPVKVIDKGVRLYKPKDGYLNILLPGTNRVDKGYFDLIYLSKSLLFNCPNVKLIIQDMKKWDVNFVPKYRRKLASQSNVEIVDPILSRNKIEDLYERAHLVLLPYDPNVYHFRGSAIHYESIMNKLPVIVRKGVGFQEEVRDWGSGWVYETQKDLIKFVEEFQNMSDEDIGKKMDSALNAMKGQMECKH